MLPSFGCNIRSVSLGIWTCVRMPLAPCSGTCTCPCRDGCQSKRNCSHRHTRSWKWRKARDQIKPIFSWDSFKNVTWVLNSSTRSKFGYKTCWTWYFARPHYCNFFCIHEKFEISWEKCCTSGIFPVHGNVAFSVGILLHLSTTEVTRLVTRRIWD